MNTRDELRAQAYTDAEARAAMARGEPVYADPEPEPVTRDDVMVACSTYSTLHAAAAGTPMAGAAWARADRAYEALQAVIAAFGAECAASGEVL